VELARKREQEVDEKALDGMIIRIDNRRASGPRPCEMVASIRKQTTSTGRSVRTRNQTFASGSLSRMHRRGFLRGIAAAAVQLALPSPKIAGLLVGEMQATTHRWVWVQSERLSAAMDNVQDAMDQLINVTVFIRDAAECYVLEKLSEP
jgi:hypothetical protein